MQGRTGVQERLAEWPTLGVAAAIYLAFAALTLLHAQLPWWLLAPLGGYVVAWHGSLQHEVVHGHPTRWPWLNELLVAPSLWLWLPYRLYRDEHRAHHQTTVLTDPLRDPESFYLSPEAWSRLGPVGQQVRRWHGTLLGRLVLGPPLALGRVLRSELRSLMRGDLSGLRAWSVHLIGGGAVVAWVVLVCGMPLWQYVLLFAYTGTSLTLLRSFAEHRAATDDQARTAVVEAGPLPALLFLNNNLHVVHHEHPGQPWYALPALWREQAPAFRARHPEQVIAGGYAELAARYLWRPREPVVYPISIR